jgi:hypothetical protein
MTLRQRVQAWRRLPSGTHVPHPAISVSRDTTASWTLTPPLTLHVDGVRRGTVRRLEVTVDVDAYHLYV